MPYMTRLLSDLKASGLTVETVPGWETRGSASFAPAGVTCHWTAGPRGTTKRPSLNVVTYGRPRLPGPLCNVYLDRNGVCVIVAAGRANHAGAGGWKHLRGNSSVYGIEAESAGDDDWTDAQKDAYPRLVAAMLRGLGRDASYAHGHNEWAPKRKIDIRDWPMATMRTQVAKLLASSPTTLTTALEEDDMFDDKARTKLDNAAWAIHNTLAPALARVDQRTYAINAKVAALDGAVDALGQSLGLDPGVISATVDKAVKDALKNLSVTLTTDKE